jgi:hypothetical protein
VQVSCTSSGAGCKDHWIGCKCAAHTALYIYIYIYIYMISAGAGAKIIRPESSIVVYELGRESRGSWCKTFLGMMLQVELSKYAHNSLVD